jgi:hypothetical protein
MPCAAGQLLVGGSFELGALLFDGLEVLRRRALRLSLRNEEVAREPVFHLDHVAQVADVGDLLEEDDLHGCLL